MRDDLDDEDRGLMRKLIKRTERLERTMRAVQTLLDDAATPQETDVETEGE